MLAPKVRLMLNDISETPVILHLIRSLRIERYYIFAHKFIGCNLLY